MVCYELMSLISCSSIPTSLPERRSQSQLSIQQQLQMGRGGISHHSLLSTPKQCLSAQRRNKKKMREQHDCFWHATSGDGDDDQVSSQFLVGRLMAQMDSGEVW